MNQLITACLKSGDIAPLVSFPRALTNAFELSVIDWILDYNRRYSEIPTQLRMIEEFPHFLPIEGSDPLGDLYDSTLKRKRHEFAISRIGIIDLKMKEDNDVPMDQLIDMMRTLGVTSSGLDSYASFDRSSYFRRGHGLSVGFRLIDRAIGGIMRGDMMLIVGRLAAGKTTIAQWIAYQWFTHRKRILYVSNEMLSDDVFARFDGMAGKFNPLLLRSESGSELESTLMAIKSAAGKIGGDIISPRSRCIRPSQVAATARFLNVDAIVVDGVHLMVPDEHAAAKWERVALVSNALKQLALDLQLPLLGVSQLKRVGDKSEYDPEDIAYSDALGQDSDFVIGIRPDGNRVELQLMKNRYGPLLTTRACINFDTMTVVDESVIVMAIEEW